MKIIYEGKHGNVCEHEDFPFHVVDSNGKHVGYYTTFDVAKGMTNKAPVIVKKEDKKEDPSKK